MDNKMCVYKALRVIGAKWTVPIIFELFEGKLRFGQLQERLKGISTKTLALRLQQLEKDGILIRKAYPVVPLKVEYSLSTKGKSLNLILEQMKKWGARQKH